MTGTIELSEYVIDAIADAVVKKMQEPCEDAISREDTLARLRADISFVCTGDKLQAMEIVNNMPSLTLNQKMMSEDEE